MINYKKFFLGILENALTALIFTFSLYIDLAICPSWGHSYVCKFYDITLQIYLFILIEVNGITEREIRFLKMYHNSKL